MQSWKIVLSMAIIFACPLPAKAQPLEPAAQRGRTLLQANCGQCHSISIVGESPLKVAPPFRTLHLKYPVDTLQEALAEGIMTGHPTMPEYSFDPGQVDDILAYLKTLER